ncbi:MAG: hypothetical protein ACLSVQ_00130 [Faecalibacterium sp.]|jgi:phosphoglycerol transferase MdoB-like AlkP superfamily enzyme|nr:MAG TPA: transmembrane protein [Bacteriophage sp.]
MKNISSLGVADILTVAFIVLKLIGVIDWPWLWVLSPFLISLALILVIFVLCVLDELKCKPPSQPKK